MSDIDESLTKGEAHPAYGMVSFSRVTCTPAREMFGSNIKHGNYISLRIKRARKGRSLNREWFFGRERMIEVNLSEAQFAEMITSMNVADGVPCTIAWTPEDGMIKLPPKKETTNETFQRELKQKLANIDQQCKDVYKFALEVANAKSAKKSDRQELANKISSLQADIFSNIPYVASAFEKTMEKTVTAAKAEVEATVKNKMFSITQLKIVEENPEMLNFDTDGLIEIGED